MKQDLKQPWIVAGYELFALHGPEGLKVEVIARNVGKNKSSFYHHFADLEIFTRKLLDYHLERVAIIAERENACQSVVPELTELLIEVKQDLFFSRQLRVNRDVQSFTECFEKANKEIGAGFIHLWAKELGLEGQATLALSLYELVLENFYLQITEENLTYDWLVGYFEEIRKMVTGFQKA